MPPARTSAVSSSSSRVKRIGSASARATLLPARRQLPRSGGRILPECRACAASRSRASAALRPVLLTFPADLRRLIPQQSNRSASLDEHSPSSLVPPRALAAFPLAAGLRLHPARSEERRVGKES